MGLEAGTYVADLVSTNPPGGDDKSQGDDHLRLIKAVLQATFPNADHAFYFPSTATKNANFSILATEQNRTFLVDTAGAARTATLPALTADDAGWQCFFLKTTADANPIFVQPASGTLQSGDITGLAKTRRGIPGTRFAALWTGSAWIIERVTKAPVGSIIDNWADAVPVGYLPAQGGAALSAADYPDYAAKRADRLLADLGGRATYGLEAVASRLTVAGSGVDGATLGSSGGAQSVALVSGNLPAGLTAPVTGISITDTRRYQFTQRNPSSDVGVQGGGGNAADDQNETEEINMAAPASGSISASGGTATLPGSGTAVNKLSPAAVVRKLMVVE